MQTSVINNPSSIKIPEKIKNCWCRGFISIDQEMEREIAVRFFSERKKLCIPNGVFSVNRGLDKFKLLYSLVLSEIEGQGYTYIHFFQTHLSGDIKCCHTLYSSLNFLPEISTAEINRVISIKIMTR